MQHNYIFCIIVTSMWKSVLKPLFIRVLAMLVPNLFLTMLHSLFLLHCGSFPHKFHSSNPHADSPLALVTTSSSRHI